jgi:hypothetical protein
MNNLTSKAVAYLLSMPASQRAAIPAALVEKEAVTLPQARAAYRRAVKMLTESGGRDLNRGIAEERLELLYSRAAQDKDNALAAKIQGQLLALRGLTPPETKTADDEPTAAGESDDAARARGHLEALKFGDGLPLAELARRAVMRIIELESRPK